MLRRHHKAVQAIVYREGSAHVDVRAVPGAWFGEVRVWRGARWPALEKRWLGRLKSWLPWYSIERQALKAAYYVSERTTLALLTTKEISAAVQRLKRELAASE